MGIKYQNSTDTVILHQEKICLAQVQLLGKKQNQLQCLLSFPPAQLSAP